MRSKWFQKMKLAFKINHWLQVDHHVSLFKCFFENCQQHSVHVGRILGLFHGRSRWGKYRLPRVASLCNIIYHLCQNLSDMQICNVERLFFHPIILHSLDWCHVCHINDPCKMDQWNMRKLPRSTFIFPPGFCQMGSPQNSNRVGCFMEWNPMCIPSSVIWIYIGTMRIIQKPSWQTSRIPISHDIMKCQKKNSWSQLTQL